MPVVVDFHYWEIANKIKVAKSYSALSFVEMDDIWYALRLRSVI